jgi:hypothetical protein
MTQTLIIQPIYPLPGSTLTVPKDGLLTLTVQITLGCGCPTCAGGRWDASRFRVEAKISLENFAMPETLIMTYSGRTSEFIGTAHIRKSGEYTIEITGQDPETGLAGRTFLKFIIKMMGQSPRPNANT